MRNGNNLTLAARRVSGLCPGTPSIIGVGRLPKVPMLVG
jgi:hypothetical protein